MFALFLGCCFTATEMSDWIKVASSQELFVQGCLDDELQAPHQLPLKFIVNPKLLTVLRLYCLILS